ncbi:MAG: hypothetical protein MMC23_007984 [Stictis urceolatum]|nr:hypothetical protein [Stictis urceolata]
MSTQPAHRESQHEVNSPTRQTGGTNKTSDVRGNVSASDTHPQGRPPVNFRDKIYPSLPRYSGVYSVGVLDIEVPVSSPRTFSSISRKGRHLLELETVLFSIYYPSALGSGSGRDSAGRGRWNRGNWLSRPRKETSEGYARFAGIPRWLMMGWFLCTTWFTLIPAHRNAQLARHWPPEKNARHAGYETKSQTGPPPEGEGESPVFPLLIFSHGLGGTRTAYSSICGEFASYGFIVIAMEHRDGSGPRTLVNHTKDGRGNIRSHDGKLDHTEKERKRGYDRVDYIFPKDNPMDTAPNNDKGVDEELRRAQLELRKAEIKELKGILEKIWRGEGDNIAKMNLRQKGFAGASTRGLKGIDWPAWKGRFHLEQITMLGHSFGAATAVEVLRHREDFPGISQGIIYDIWGAPVRLKDELQIEAPLLAINSEAFMYWEKNFDVVSQIVDEARSNGALCWMMTVQGTIHISQSDFHLLYPRTCRHLLRATVHPKRAITLNINASLEFLKLVMPERISKMNRGDDEGILSVTVLDELPTDRMPDQKWIAMSLKAPHDLVRRARKYKGGAVDKEVWMHVAPTDSELESWGFERVGEGDKKGLRKKDGQGRVDVLPNAAGGDEKSDGRVVNDAVG